MNGVALIGMTDGEIHALRLHELLPLLEFECYKRRM